MGDEAAADGDASGRDDSSAPSTIVVQFRPEYVATWLATDRAPAELVEIGDEVLSAGGSSIAPMHPGAEAPEMAAWFTVQVVDPTEEQRVLRLLRASNAVIAAYTKPPDALPG